MRRSGCRQGDPPPPPPTFADFFASVASLKRLEFIGIRGLAFTGGLLPDAPASGQATVCDLVSTGPLNRLSIMSRALNGELPACLFNASSRLLALSIGATLTLSIQGRPSTNGLWDRLLLYILPALLVHPETLTFPQVFGFAAQDVHWSVGYEELGVI